jgi:hypothetical protein
VRADETGSPGHENSLLIHHLRFLQEKWRLESRTLRQTSRAKFADDY